MRLPVLVGSPNTCAYFSQERHATPHVAGAAASTFATSVALRHLRWKLWKSLRLATVNRPTQ